MTQRAPGMADVQVARSGRGPEYGSGSEAMVRSIASFAARMSAEMLIANCFSAAARSVPQPETTRLVQSTLARAMTSDCRSTWACSCTSVSFIQLLSSASHSAWQQAFHGISFSEVYPLK